MNSSILFILFAFFICQTFSTFSLRVSHQVSGLYDVPLDVRVDGESVPEFNNTFYTQASEYVEFEDAAEILLTVYISGTNNSLLNILLVNSEGLNTFFIIQDPGSDELSGLVLSNEDVDPTQYYSNFRIINLATTNQSVDVVVDDHLVFPELEYSQSTSQTTIGAGVHYFEIVNQTLNSFTLASGVDYTFVINFLGGTTTDLYQIILLVDFEFEYPTCQFRGLNAVPNDQSISIHVDDLVLSLEYSQVSDYEDLPVGEYDVTFRRGAQILATTPFSCESSERYSLALVGDTSIGQPYIGQIIDDSTFAPYYLETTVRVVLLSPSPLASPATVFFEGNNEGDVLYPHDSAYFSSANEVAGIKVVSNGLVLIDTPLTLKLGTSFSLFVLGLVDEARAVNDYPITSLLVSDFQAQPTPTTTTTTTTSTTSTSTTSSSTTKTTGTTTGSSDDEDDDDDDGLTGGQIAGIVIGVLVGVALFGGLAFFLLKRRAAQGDSVYAQFEHQ